MNSTTHPSAASRTGKAIVVAVAILLVVAVGTTLSAGAKMPEGQLCQ